MGTWSIPKLKRLITNSRLHYFQCGLDYTQMKNMSKAIGKIKENVSYVLIITHDPEFILECCEYVIELDKGMVKHTYQLDSSGCEMLYDFFNIE